MYIYPTNTHWRNESLFNKSAFLLSWIHQKPVFATLNHWVCWTGVLWSSSWNPAFSTLTYTRSTGQPPGSEQRRSMHRRQTSEWSEFFFSKHSILLISKGLVCLSWFCCWKFLFIALKYQQENLNGPISSCLLKNLTPSIIYSITLILQVERSV